MLFKDSYKGALKVNPDNPPTEGRGETEGWRNSFGEGDWNRSGFGHDGFWSGGDSSTGRESL
jgi:hypothetical protein